MLKRPGATINDLAEAVGINPISVRHHLTNLQMEGLVEAQSEAILAGFGDLANLH